jgi:hypothetical protein
MQIVSIPASPLAGTASPWAQGLYPRVRRNNASWQIALVTPNILLCTKPPTKQYSSVSSWTGSASYLRNLPRCSATTMQHPNLQRIKLVTPLSNISRSSSILSGSLLRRRNSRSTVFVPRTTRPTSSLSPLGGRTSCIYGSTWAFAPAHSCLPISREEEHITHVMSIHFTLHSTLTPYHYTLSHIVSYYTTSCYVTHCFTDIHLLITYALYALTDSQLRRSVRS